MTPLDTAAKALYDAGRPARATAEHWSLEWDDPMMGGTRDRYREQVRTVLSALGFAPDIAIVEWVSMEDGQVTATRRPITDLPNWAQGLYR